MPHQPFYQVIVYGYPESGNCEDCDYSEPIESSQTFRFQTFLCQAGCTLNDGQHCPTKEVKPT